MYVRTWACNTGVEPYATIDTNVERLLLDLLTGCFVLGTITDLDDKRCYYFEQRYQWLTLCHKHIRGTGH